MIPTLDYQKLLKHQGFGKMFKYRQPIITLKINIRGPLESKEGILAKIPNMDWRTCI